MTRAALREPMLDQMALITLVDPEPASIAHLQRLDRRVHALATAWGGTGFYMALNMSNTESPDDFEFALPVPPGVEWMRVYALVSQRDKADPKPCEAVISSANTTTSTTLRWQEVSGGNTLGGAYAIVTADDGDGDTGPLRVQSGVDWSWDFDLVTIVFDVGIGTIWGLLFQPIHQDRPA